MNRALTGLHSINIEQKPAKICDFGGLFRFGSKDHSAKLPSVKMGTSFPLSLIHI